MSIKVELYNESCFDLLKGLEDNSVDLVLIDPPYQISKDSGFTRSKETGTYSDRFRVSMDFGEWDTDFLDLSLVISESYRVLKRGGTLICFYDLWKISELKGYFDLAKFKQLRFIEWIKTNPVPINSKVNYLTNSREIAVTGVKVGKGVFNSKYDNGIYNYPIYQSSERFHPTQKPLLLIEELIKKHSVEGSLVLDCFSGSGTTALASMNTGRNFIGCEISKNYFELSKNRLEGKNTNESTLIFTQET